MFMHIILMEFDNTTTVFLTTSSQKQNNGIFDPALLPAEIRWRRRTNHIRSRVFISITLYP